MQDILKRDEKFRYMMLGRFQSDCEYYLNNGNRNAKHLWARNEKDHIENMYALYCSFPFYKKPKWCNRKQLRKYRKQMLTQ